MGQKREHSEVGSPEPRDRASFNGAKKRKQSKTKHRPNEGTSTWAKKRTRTIERLLNRNQELPANVRNDLERELGALKATVDDKSFQKLRSAMISKYHMVRFFGTIISSPVSDVKETANLLCVERKKASRLSRQLRKKIDETESTETEELEGLKRDLHIAEVDEAYTQHFPHAEPYISLYTNAKSEKQEEEKDDDKLDYTPLKQRGLLHTERPPIWSEVEQAMKDGSHALRNLRERRPAEVTEPTKPERNQNKANALTSKDKTVPAAKAQPKKEVKPTPYTKGKPGAAPKNRRERRLAERQGAQPVVTNDDDDSDEGGFFEED
ncbi:rRNA-processing protein efg1 [Fusarium equiseti]|uniref:rRNA-processing protein EFG1 n=1 Tax=Fusarium equiseti TaxID=61235 RepID=A0ABQ8RSQ2_FUSEQ|nr:rRNA-processing protein efg1 [Fusarium equiseti]